MAFKTPKLLNMQLERISWNSPYYNFSSIPDGKQYFLTYAGNTFRRRSDKTMARLTDAPLFVAAFCVWAKWFCALDCLYASIIDI